MRILQSGLLALALCAPVGWTAEPREKPQQEKKEAAPKKAPPAKAEGTEGKGKPKEAGAVPMRQLPAPGDRIHPKDQYPTPPAVPAEPVQPVKP